VKAPLSNLVKVPRVIAMMVLLRLARRIRSCDGARVETAMGAAITATSRPEQSGGPARRENLQRSGREEAGPGVQALPGPRINLPAGGIFSPRGLRAEPAGSKGGRDEQGWDSGNRDRGLIGVSPEHR
jgi:hypothetical protein